MVSSVVGAGKPAPLPNMTVIPFNKLVSSTAGTRAHGRNSTRTRHQLDQRSQHRSGRSGRRRGERPLPLRPCLSRVNGKVVVDLLIGGAHVNRGTPATQHTHLALEPRLVLPGGSHVSVSAVWGEECAHAIVPRRQRRRRASRRRRHKRRVRDPCGTPFRCDGHGRHRPRVPAPHPTHIVPACSTRSLAKRAHRCPQTNRVRSAALRATGSRVTGQTRCRTNRRPSHQGRSP